MTDLIVCFENKKGVLEHIKRVIKDVEWEKIYVVTPEDISLDLGKKVEIIKIDMSKTIGEVSENIMERLKEKLNDIEVAINIVGGSGKEHTALISAVLKLGMGIRLVVLTPDGVKSV
ncbi:MAG: hypothetical protein ABIJ08_02215 [Nanoarchaeota archaeon]